MKQIKVALIRHLDHLEKRQAEQAADSLPPSSPPQLTLSLPPAIEYKDEGIQTGEVTRPRKRKALEDVESDLDMRTIKSPKICINLTLCGHGFPRAEDTQEDARALNIVVTGNGTHDDPFVLKEDNDGKYSI